MLRALIFDFDGLILNTEEPIFRSWQELYRDFGGELTLDKWAAVIGTAEMNFDPLADIQRQTGFRPDEAALLRRSRREAELIQQQAILPGVRSYLEEARQMNLKIGLASSSPCSWVVGHLTRLGLVDFFGVIIASDDVPRTKPDPALYQLALLNLGVESHEAIAFEDSPLGIQAAKAAGIFCVAVPNDLTRRLDTSFADYHLNSLADMPLAALLQSIQASKRSKAAPERDTTA